MDYDSYEDDNMYDEDWQQPEFLMNFDLMDTLVAGRDLSLGDMIDLINSDQYQGIENLAYAGPRVSGHERRTSYNDNNFGFAFSNVSGGRCVAPSSFLERFVPDDDYLVIGEGRYVIDDFAAARQFGIHSDDSKLIHRLMTAILRLGFVNDSTSEVLNNTSGEFYSYSLSGFFGIEGIVSIEITHGGLVVNTRTNRYVRDRDLISFVKHVCSITELGRPTEISDTQRESYLRSSFMSKFDNMTDTQIEEGIKRRLVGGDLYPIPTISQESMRKCIELGKSLLDTCAHVISDDEDDILTTTDDGDLLVNSDQNLTAVSLVGNFFTVPEVLIDSVVEKTISDEFRAGVGLMAKAESYNLAKTLECLKDVGYGLYSKSSEGVIKSCFTDSLFTQKGTVASISYSDGAIRFDGSDGGVYKNVELTLDSIKFDPGKCEGFELSNRDSSFCGNEVKVSDPEPPDCPKIKIVAGGDGIQIHAIDPDPDEAYRLVSENASYINECNQRGEISSLAYAMDASGPSHDPRFSCSANVLWDGVRVSFFSGPWPTKKMAKGVCIGLLAYYLKERVT